MSYNKNQIKPYANGFELIPLLQWNKMIKGKGRGKTPLHKEWTTKQYVQDLTQYNNWIKAGYNIGVRLTEQQVVIDLDPRNYIDGINTEELVAELFGYFDFDEIQWDHAMIQTGSGGWHIYCTLPNSVDYKLIRKAVTNIPGMDIKKKGGYVVAAGSKHPCGEYYKWVNEEVPQPIPTDMLNLIKRDKFTSQHNTVGYGAFNGTQLQELILDKLDITDYNTNDTWEPILMSAHHATAGDGVEEFIEWCIGDPEFTDDEHTIRTRWESLEDKEGTSITAATLLKELKSKGEDNTNAKAVLEFGGRKGMYEDEKEDFDEDEKDLFHDAEDILNDIDVDDIYKVDEGSAGEEGSAIQFANSLHVNSHQEEIMKAIRLIKAANSIESIQAQDILVGKKILKQGAISKLLKELDATIAEDLAVILRDKTLQHTFNNGKHIVCPPSGILYIYNKTHWQSISDEFLTKLIQKVLEGLKSKIDIKTQELSLVNQTTKLCRIKSSTMKDRLHSTELPQPVINCKNGELWLNKDGTHELRPHNYRSYLRTCLNVDYDPSAECPLFMQTISDIFGNFDDTEDMVRHLAELFGYTIQPYKNIASWWLFRGPGGDGKSTLLKILGGILGDAQVNSTVSLLNNASGNGDNHALTSVVGALNIVIEELPANHLLKDEGVKLFSENTKMQCNPKGAQQFPFMYAGNLIMCSNGFPATRDLSHGMVRRANVLPFNRQFTATGNEDLDRAVDILSSPEEMSGVLNFMLDGLARLRDRGRFLVPESCAVAKEEWLGQANNVVRFTKDKIEKTSNYADIICSLSDIYSIHYDIWCDDNGIEDKLRKSKGQFIKDLENLGYKVRKGGKNVMKVYGGKLILEEEDNFDELDDF